MNTIPVDREPTLPGDPQIERRLRSIVRWNAMAMVVRANKTSSELGGHIASFQSLATLYEVGFNHFWHAPSDDHGGDLVYFQGHSSPGNYARAYLEGRLTESQLDNFRQEVDGDGLSSYPHPWLMPDFWQFPTVSLGIGAISSIYQARFMKYLGHRGIADTAGRKVWAFLGDGEMDEPESMGATALAGREKLDNLIWVVNCNLQRLDGPVRGNGKIIQELESDFRGAGWNVIKVIWGSRWDPLLAADTDGALVKVMEDCVDGDYQTFKSRDGAYVREHFFGRDPRLLERVKDMTDDQIWYLNRGGHDQQKVYAAYHAAVEHTGQPTVILAKTIKGYGMGVSGEGQMITHQAKKMTEAALLAFRDRFELPLTDEQVRTPSTTSRPRTRPRCSSCSSGARRSAARCRRRAQRAEPLAAPPLELFKSQLEGTGEREISTTMAFVRILAALLRDKTIGSRVVPIVPDESRTFGMEGLFRQVGIYSPVGQLYRPQDSEQLMFYKEDQTGQILEEGITEAGSTSSFVAAGTSYSTHATSMVPFYIYYSMFGYQRVGDLIWAAGDSRTRGFMLGGDRRPHHAQRRGAPARGRPQPPAVLGRAQLPRLRPRVRLRGRGDHPGRAAPHARPPAGRLLLPHADERELPPPGDARGGAGGDPARHAPARRGAEALAQALVQLLGSGTILLEVIAAAELLQSDWGVLSDVWSVTSFSELRRDGIEAERFNMLHPGRKQPRAAFVTEQLQGRRGPVIASTDYLRAVPDQIRQWVAVAGRAPLSHARHRRLRAQRLSRRAAPVLRDRSLLRDRRGAHASWRPRERSTRRSSARRSRSTGSTPRPRSPRRRDPVSATSAGKVAVPDIGDFGDVPVIEILVSAGDTVSAEDPLVTLESDKATMDVPAPFGGVVKSISVAVGDTVSEGSDLMVIEQTDGDPGGGDAAETAAAADRSATETAAPAEAAAEPAPEQSSSSNGGDPAPETIESAPPAPGESAAAASGPIYASPSVRRLARELGVDLQGATGTGRKGRLTQQDVRGLASGAGAGGDGAAGTGGAGGRAAAPGGAGGLDLLPWPQVDFEKFGPVERVARSRIQRISAPNLARNWVMIPHVTQNDEADITDLEAWRKELNADYKGAVKFTMVSFLVKAAVVALKEFPDVNSSLDGDELVRKRYYNIGFAADTPNGLVVPVIKDADRKGLAEIASDLTELSGKAREGKLGPADMSGATFTISSLGGIGGTSFTPIINAPEVAILGVTRVGDEARLGRRRVRAAADGAAVVLLRPSRDRRRRGGALHRVPRRGPLRPASGAAVSDITVPDIGDFEDVPVIEILVSAGDTVSAEDPLVTLESDKATMDVPAPFGGTIESIDVSVGDRVSQGSKLMTVSAGTRTSRPAPRSPSRRAPRARAGRRRGAERQRRGARAPRRGARDGRRRGARDARARRRDAEPTPPADDGADRDFQVVVLGSGPGGYTAAFRAADLGLKVALVERDEQLGGVCLNVGCIPSKALLHAARVITETHEMAEHGVRFGEPKVDLGALIGWKQSVVDRLTGGLSQLAKQRKVEVIAGEAPLHRREHAAGRRARGELRERHHRRRLGVGADPGPARRPARDRLDRRALPRRDSRADARDRRRDHRPGDGVRLRRARHQGDGRRDDGPADPGRRPRSRAAAGQADRRALRRRDARNPRRHPSALRRTACR